MLSGVGVGDFSVYPQTLDSWRCYYCDSSITARLPGLPQQEKKRALSGTLSYLPTCLCLEVTYLTFTGSPLARMSPMALTYLQGKLGNTEDHRRVFGDVVVSANTTLLLPMRYFY